MLLINRILPRGWVYGDDFATEDYNLCVAGRLSILRASRKGDPHGKGWRTASSQQPLSDLTLSPITQKIPGPTNNLVSELGSGFFPR